MGRTALFHQAPLPLGLVVTLLKVLGAVFSSQTLFSHQSWEDHSQKMVCADAGVLEKLHQGGLGSMRVLCPPGMLGYTVFFFFIRPKQNEAAYPVSPGNETLLTQLACFQQGFERIV